MFSVLHWKMPPLLESPCLSLLCLWLAMLLSGHAQGIVHLAASFEPQLALTICPGMGRQTSLGSHRSN